MAEPGSKGSGCLLSLTEPTPITGTIPALRELRSEALHGFLRESAEHQRSFDRLQVVGIVLGDQERPQLRGPTSGVGVRTAVAGVHGAASRAAIHGVDLEHLGDGSHAGDRFLGKFADAEGQRSRQLAVQINRAAAHARDHSGIFRLLARQADQDDVALGAVRILQNSENFHSHGLGLGALEYGVGHAVHPGMDLAHGNGFNRLGGLGLND